jgi:hypothetical protein
MARRSREIDVVERAELLERHAAAMEVIRTERTTPQERMLMLSLVVWPTLDVAAAQEAKAREVYA